MTSPFLFALLDGFAKKRDSTALQRFGSSSIFDRNVLSFIGQWSAPMRPRRLKFRALPTGWQHLSPHLIVSAHYNRVTIDDLQHPQKQISWVVPHQRFAAVHYDEKANQVILASARKDKTLFFETYTPGGRLLSSTRVHEMHACIDAVAHITLDPTRTYLIYQQWRSLTWFDRTNPLVPVFIWNCDLGYGLISDIWADEHTGVTWVATDSGTIIQLMIVDHRVEEIKVGKIPEHCNTVDFDRFHRCIVALTGGDVFAKYYSLSLEFLENIDLLLDPAPWVCIVQGQLIACL